ncbi:MAG: hypothetical protein AAF299_10040 [Pseudomonadota bacterium]
MSYELPFSKPGGWSVQKVILLALIAVHAAWIVFHLTLVSRELVNPWKLGGYGMYTTAHPKPAIHVFDSRFGSVEVSISDEDRLQMARENNYFILRCHPLSVDSLQNFLKNNPRFVGVPLRFIISELKMLRDPIRPERLPHAILEIRWTGQTTFKYAGKVCDQLFRGNSELKS